MRDILQLRSGEELLVGPCLVVAAAVAAFVVVVVVVVAVAVST
jgi:hypothetical protein